MTGPFTARHPRFRLLRRTQSPVGQGHDGRPGAAGLGERAGVDDHVLLSEPLERNQVVIERMPGTAGGGHTQFDRPILLVNDFSDDTLACGPSSRVQRWM